MERRNFLKGALAIFGAGVVGVSMMPTAAEAAPADLTKDLPNDQLAEGVQEPVTDASAELDQTDDAQAQYYYRRRYYRPRRVFYRPRRVYYRPRRVYYRPRRVYYRPRRVYYRRRFW